jgi:aspartate aminotransferase
MPEQTPTLSRLAETLIGSEIVRMNAEIKERMKNGDRIFNFTIGDFDPSIFPIPVELEEEIIHSYRKHFTNYPAGEGEAELRKSVAQYIRDRQGPDYAPDEVLIASGGRPLIYTAYRAICDEGDKVIYSIPSWNNNHYVHFVKGEHCAVVASPANLFMPTAEEIRPHLPGARLLALCSPQNPTGTTFTKAQLEAICDLVLEENARRGPGEKKLYILYDQIYWQLTYGDIVHHDPVSLRPALKEYTLFVDGISKCYAATGVRVGWSMGPKNLIGKMKAILSHVGAWAPLPEQRATTRYLMQKWSVDQYLRIFKAGLHERLVKIYNHVLQLRKDGLPVDAIAPQAAMYLTVKIEGVGKKTAEGQLLGKQSDVTRYLLDEAKLALVPFSAFGASPDSPWYRLSVGTCKIEEIPEMIGKLRTALARLQ